MAKDSRKVASDEAVRADGATSLETLIRQRARGLIDAIVEEELEAALGAAESARVGAARQGYRHGTRERTLTTSLGPTTFAMPRARLRTAEGASVEWRSDLVPRYQRRSERVDEAILGVYLSGTNTRRIKGALAPLLLGGTPGRSAAARHRGRQCRLGRGLARAMADGGDSTLHRAQAQESRGQGAGAPARGARRRVPTDDLRREPNPRRSGARPIHEEVAAAMSRGGRVSRGGGRRSLHLFALSEDAVEGPADDQCPRAHQRRVPTPHQNASESARTRGRPPAALWFAAQRSREATENRRLGGDETHREGSVTQLLRAGS